MEIFLICPNAHVSVVILGDVFVCERAHEDQNFKASLSYMVSLRPAWTTQDHVFKKRRRIDDKVAKYTERN